MHCLLAQTAPDAASKAGGTLAPDAPARPPSPAQKRAVGQFALITVVGVVAIVLVAAMAMTLIARHRRRVEEAVRQSHARKRRAGTGVDPWVEAGRRTTPDPNDPDPPWNSDDDTVDLDPPDTPPPQPRKS